MERLLLGVLIQISMGLRLPFKVIGLSLLLLGTTVSFVSAQSKYSGKFSTGGVYLGQSLSELQIKEELVVKKVRENLFDVLDTATNNSIRIEVKRGAIVGVDFSGPLYQGDQLLFGPGNTKEEVFSRLVGLTPSYKGDFVCFVLPEGSRLLLKLDDEEGFINGYLEKP